MKQYTIKDITIPKKQILKIQKDLKNDLAVLRIIMQDTTVEIIFSDQHEFSKNYNNLVKDFYGKNK